jgi:hypothetical protein
MVFFISCPHCLQFVEIEQINCGIFRHAVFKSSGQQVPPHLSKEECVKLLELNEVFGCCKPFRLVQSNDNSYVAVECGYI